MSQRVVEADVHGPFLGSIGMFESRRDMPNIQIAASVCSTGKSIPVLLGNFNETPITLHKNSTLGNIHVNTIESHEVKDEESVIGGY